MVKDNYNPTDSTGLDIFNQSSPQDPDPSSFLGSFCLSKLDDLVIKIEGSLMSKNPFILWMDAPMGAGKTTTVSCILRHLGLSDSHPVLSPTYTYINEYKIGDLYYAHLDLYRLNYQATLEDLGIDYQNYRGFFIEWPSDKLNSFDLSSTHILSIRYPKTSEDTRDYYFKAL